MSHLYAVPHDCRNEDDMDDDVDRMGVVGSIERELLDVRIRTGNEKICHTCFLVSNNSEMAMADIHDGSGGRKSHACLGCHVLT